MEKQVLQMMDTIHKCLFCGSVAYASNENEYSCTNDDCGLVWKVVDCESK